jgi:hypothetical protein
LTPHTELGIGVAISLPAAMANVVRDALTPLGVEINETSMTPRCVVSA